MSHYIPVPFGKLTSLWKITVLMGKSTISMAILNSKLLNYQRVTMFVLQVQALNQEIFPASAVLKAPATMIYRAVICSHSKVVFEYYIYI